MPLDSHTIYVLSAFSLFGAAALVALAAHSYPEDLRKYGFLWALATLVQALGMGAIALRGIVPDAASVLAAHGFGIAGLAGFLHALTRYAGLRARLPAIYGPAAVELASCAYFFFVVPSYAARVVIFSVIAALLLGRCSMILWRTRVSEAPLTSRVAAVAFGIGSVLLAVRAAASMTIDPAAKPGTILRASALEQSIVVVVSLEYLLLAFTFVLLCNERLSSRLRRLAIIDPLTGHFNRRGILDQGRREVARARRNRLPLSVAVVDLDRFKKLNDSDGHAFGDQVLCHVADSLERGLRAQDCFGRWGGDEFLAVLPDTGLDGAREACERVRSLVASSPVQHDGTSRDCTVSIGVASRDSRVLEFETLVHEADQALYVAKRKGRNAIATA